MLVSCQTPGDSNRNGTVSERPKKTCVDSEQDLGLLGELIYRDGPVVVG